MYLLEKWELLPLQRIQIHFGKSHAWEPAGVVIVERLPELSRASEQSEPSSAEY